MKNILITGLPGVGKTTLIKKIFEIFKEFNPMGFYTEEVITSGMRQGFEVFNLNGESRVLAHINLKSKYIIGKYKVDIKGFDGFIDKIFIKEKKAGLYIIDEIGKMECKSRKFSKLIIELLNSEKPVIATIADKGQDVIEEIKKRNDVRLFEITQNNREIKLKELTIIARDILLK